MRWVRAGALGAVVWGVPSLIDFAQGERGIGGARWFFWLVFVPVGAVLAIREGARGHDAKGAVAAAAGTTVAAALMAVLYLTTRATTPPSGEDLGPIGTALIATVFLIPLFVAALGAYWLAWSIGARRGRSAAGLAV